ncbi:MAG: hypothetical protein QM711_16925 [Micropruina sp.]|uniref:hypothetical protein n=1 Tax=Micropruina sp. TaxID=2737536 RepID=UPI0039E28906
MDADRLGIFATRVGVDARRAVEVLPPRELTEDLVRGILLPRGEAFASAFIRHACVSSRRPWENCPTIFGAAAVLLLHELELPVPDNVDYLKDWIVMASGSLGLPAPVDPFRAPLPAELLRPRFVEHLRVLAGLGVPVTGFFPDLFGSALRQGWLDREAALECALQGLDTVRRPGDHAVWTRLIADVLAVTDDELLAQVDALVPALATGNATVVESFAPRLIARVGDDLLAEVLIAALGVRTKKALRLVLSAATARAVPSHAVVAELTDSLLALTADKDRAVARAARALLDRWSVARQVATADAVGARGRWRPTPALWAVPRFEPEQPSVETLARAAGVLVSRPEEAFDIATERFLQLVNGLARTDIAATRRGLRGVATEWTPGLRPVTAWLDGTRPSFGLDGYLDRVEDVLLAREFAVFQRLGQVPVLLSTPSWIDLRIDPSDLVTRLGRYRDESADAIEADLQLALARVDPALVTDMHQRALERAGVRVIGQNGRRMWRKAGPVAAAYLRDPIRDPGLVQLRTGQWRAAPVSLPRSLKEFPARLATTGYSGLHESTVFPAWSDAAASGLWFGVGASAAMGVTLRQQVRRAQPFGPAAAVNLLGAQRAPHPKAAGDAMTAVIEAWQRGLLRPGVADVRYLDWEGTPRSVAAFARVSLDVAEDGMASLVWPVLDDLITMSLARERLLPGTADVAEALLDLAPEAVATVDAGLAEPSVLVVPGLRALAARAGGSRAVVAARAVIAEIGERSR